MITVECDGEKFECDVDEQGFPVLPGYFAFSQKLRTAGRLNGWREWFDNKGIAHKTVRVKGRFVLYREGEEAVGKEHGERY